MGTEQQPAQTTNSAPVVQTTASAPATQTDASTAAPQQPAQSATEQNPANASQQPAATTENQPGQEAKPEQTAQQQQDSKAQQQAEVKYDIKLAEGSPIDAALVEDLVSFAKEKGLSPEQAQALVDREEQIVKDFVQAQAEQVQKQKEDWKKACVTDKEIGGPEFAKNVELSTRFLKKYGHESIVKYLDDSGLGNHPEVVRMFVKLAKDVGVGEDVIPKDGGGVIQKKSHAEILYGSSSNQQGS